MGGRIEVEPARWRAAAGSVRQAGEELALLSWPAIESGVLPGSEVERSTAPEELAARAGALAAALQHWADAAAAAADDLARAEARSADRLGR